MSNLLRRSSILIVYLFLVLNALLVLGPVIWTVLASFKPGNNLFSSSFTDIAFTLEHYRTLFSDTPYIDWYKNTFMLATANMLISLVVVTTSAYVFSRYRFKGKRNVLLSILVFADVPGIFIDDCHLYSFV